jgi:hypothetical protein
MILPAGPIGNPQAARRPMAARSLQWPMAEGAGDRARSRRSRALRAAVVLAVAAVIALVTLALANRSRSSRSRPATGSSCNGTPGLCARRLDEVIFAGTHNSFAASAEPGWYFANQRYPISRQLQDGIRALLIDVHFGVLDRASGRVRTDLRAEGADRNKVAAKVPAAALAVADRVTGRVGLGSLKGTPELYLCHTLCELGSEPLDRELSTIKQFLDRHRDQVLVLIVEDYVPPRSIAEAFARAGLAPYLATLDVHQPLPTLGTLVARGQRLVVFAEEKGGSPSWYMPAFAFIQDTPLGAKRPDQLSCRRDRGEPHSPLLLINYWIPPFPPSPSANAKIGRAPFLRSRLEDCLRERRLKGAMVAVDFYERTSVVKLAAELNGQNAGG